LRRKIEDFSIQNLRFQLPTQFVVWGFFHFDCMMKQDAGKIMEEIEITACNEIVFS